ncbi:hypothetical protein [Paenibacillus sp. OAS669]|uniref:hypothetical protein n=1 Tax=Paenibacillus sp. OAS669 TaxID=2663821 RepID=UPI001789F7CB|nr:hypothetical protein [Paenibacillus sp. OAS669]MBE1445780.1 hypothetical protein [Paenibacillus sp. OAS669]
MTITDSSSGVAVVNGISLTVVALSTLSLTIRIRAYSSQLSKMTAMMAAMALAMMTGLAAGTILGIWLQSLFFSTALGMLWGIAVGYFTGERHSWLAAMDGMLSGIMGGMMGAMLGVMEIDDHPVLTVIFMDAIMLLIMAILYNCIKSEAPTHKQRSLSTYE